MSSRSIFLAFTAALLLAGCKTSGDTQAGSEPTATDDRPPYLIRAQQRWDALLARDGKTAYTFLSPGAQSLTTPETYAAGSGVVNYKSAEAVDAECTTETSCTVRVYVLSSTRLPHAGEVEVPAYVFERWLKIDGQWYHVPERE